MHYKNEHVLQNDIHHDLYAEVSYIIYVDPICIGKQ